MSKAALKIAENLILTLTAATQKLGWLGTTGSGKTYGASKFAEQLWHAGVQFVVLDPVGVWYGLRLAPGGKKPSNINIPIFGGLHGDIPLEATSGALIADLVVDKGISVILDVSQFESDADKARFAGDFGRRFFFRKKASPSAVHVFLEECQEFVPQNPQRGEEKMLHEYVRMQKLGRNFGIGTSLISQRPQEVNKKALNMAQTLFVFRTTGTHERDAIMRWIKDKALDENLAEDLPKMETGTCHVWSPEFLKMSEMSHILKKETHDASATPEVGQKKSVVHLSDIDLKSLQTDMAATIERAKMDDPKILKERILKLEKELKNGSTTSVAPKTNTPVVDIKKVLQKRDREWELIVRDWKYWGEHLFEKLRRVTAAASWDDEKMHNRPMSAPPETTQASDGVSPARVLHDSRHKAAAANAPTALPSGAPQEGVTGPEQRVLNAIAWMNVIGVDEPVNELVAFLSGYSHALSKGYTVPRGALRTRGLIDYPKPGTVCLTEAGKSAAQYPETPGSREELQRIVLDRLDGPKRRVLEPLIKSYPEPMSNEDLCAAAGYSHPLSKGYTVPRGKLKTFGLVDYPTSGHVRAADVLFI